MAANCQVLYLTVIFCQYVLAQVSIAVLQSVPDAVHAIGPQTIHELVLPLVTALCNRLVLLVNENGLDAGRTELYAEHGLSALYKFFGRHLFGVQV